MSRTESPFRRPLLLSAVCLLGLLPFVWMLWGPATSPRPSPAPPARRGPSLQPSAGKITVQEKPPDESSATEKTSREPTSFLTEVERKQIWDIEHEAYLLGEKTFPHFKDLLTNESFDDFQELFQEQFHGELLYLPEMKTHPDFPYLKLASASHSTHSTVVTAVRLPSLGGASEMAGIRPPGDTLAISEPPRRRPTNPRGAEPFDAAGHDSAQENNDLTLRSAGIEKTLEYFKNLLALFLETPSLACKITSLKHREDPNDETELSDLKLKMTLKGVGLDSGPLIVTLIQDLTVGRVTDDSPSPAHWIRSWKMKSVRALSSQAPFFEDVTEQSGLASFKYHDQWTVERPKGTPKPDISGGIYLADYNRDGWLDALVTDLYGCFLFRGAPSGRFEPDKDFDPGARSEISALWADVNNDGWVDLVLGTQLFWNTEGRLVSAGKRFPNSRFTRDPQWSVGDYDNDGLVDLYALNMGRPSPLLLKGEGRGFLDPDLTSYIENVLWKNRGDGEFEDVTQRAGASGLYGKSFATVWLHGDQDLFPEIFVANEFGRNAYLANNRNGTFTLRNVDPGWGGFSMGACSGDVNNDGRTDIYLSNMYSSAGQRILEHVNFDRYPDPVRESLRHIVDGNYLYISAGDHRFDERGISLGIHDVGWAYSGAMFDMNNDSYLDLYAPAGHHSVSSKAPDG